MEVAAGAQVWGTLGVETVVWPVQRRHHQTVQAGAHLGIYVATTFVAAI